MGNRNERGKRILLKNTWRRRQVRSNVGEIEPAVHNLEMAACANAARQGNRLLHGVSDVQIVCFGVGGATVESGQANE